MAYLLFGAVTSEPPTAEAADDPGTIAFVGDQEVFRFGLELLSTSYVAPGPKPGSTIRTDRDLERYLYIFLVTCKDSGL